MADGIIISILDAKAYPYLLIDTCVLIDEFKNWTGVFDHFWRRKLRVPLVALWEFLHGEGAALLDGSARLERRNWLRKHGIEAIWFSKNAEPTFRRLAGLGGDLPEGPDIIDCLIAAECLSRGVPVLTKNCKHFLAVPGVKVVSPGND